MKPIYVVFLFTAVALGAPACQRTSDEGDTKRVPKPPPPEELKVPVDLRIEVTIDGAPGATIDAPRLEANKADFADQDRHAWKLVELLGDSTRRPGSVMAIAAKGGPEVLLRPAPTAADPQPVLLVSRRGEVVATMIDPKAPFPEYHGRGGRLGRTGDPLPRVSGVTKIRVFVETQ